MSASTSWPDVSEHNNKPATDALLGWSHWSGWFAFRVCDGTYRDRLAAANLAWAAACRTLVGMIGYCVFPRSVGQSTPAEVAAAYIDVIRGHRPRLVTMIDVESWGGHVKGDHSEPINQLRHLIAGHLNRARPSWQRAHWCRWYYQRRDLTRVCLYGNATDLHTICPNRHGARVVLANWSEPAKYPGEVARQTTDRGTCPPWSGRVDLNTAQLSPKALARALGLGRLRWSLR